MIVLDTDVVSALMRFEPDRAVVRWLDRQSEFSVWITSITLMEIQFGIETMPNGRKRDGLQTAFREFLDDQIEQRVAYFDVESARYAASLMARRQLTGAPVELKDTMIAAIAIANRASIATRNVRHFGELPIPVFSPWDK